MSAYSSELQCAWYSWEADSPGELSLNVGAEDIPSMSAVIRIAQAIMPSVFVIRTFRAGKRDTTYLLSLSGDWKSFS